MQIKHRVRINVADRNGNQQNVLESRKLRVPQRILRLLFGDFCEVLVLTPGKSVQGHRAKASKASRSSSCEVKHMKADTHNWPRDG